MDYLVCVTLRRLSSPGEAEVLLESFSAASSHSAPVVGEDLEAGTIDVTFLVSAEDVEDAFMRGRSIVTSSLARERDAHEVLGMSLETADHDQLR
jgi:hypothetical protein